MSRLEISRSGLELIESFEGFRAKSARLGDGRFTIGFGHSLTARDGMVVSREQAEELLRWDLGPIEDFIRQNALTTLSQNQYDALVSFVFNIGIENFKTSDVLRHLNQGEPISAAIAMAAWRRANINGKHIIVDALVRRRALEAAMFLDSAGPRPAAPSSIIAPYLDYSASLLAPKPANIKNVTFEQNSIEPQIENDDQIAPIELAPVEDVKEIESEPSYFDDMPPHDEVAPNDGKVISFPKVGNDEFIIPVKPHDNGEAVASISPISADLVDKKAEAPIVNDIKIATQPLLVGEETKSQTIIDKPVKPLKNNVKLVFDPFTIFLIFAGMVAFVAGLYEALGQGLFNIGLKGLFDGANNLFVLLTMTIGLVIAIFGAVSLVRDESVAR